MRVDERLGAAAFKGGVNVGDEMCERERASVACMCGGVRCERERAKAARLRPRRRSESQCLCGRCVCQIEACTKANKDNPKPISQVLYINLPITAYPYIGVRPISEPEKCKSASVSWCKRKHTNRACARSRVKCVMRAGIWRNLLSGVDRLAPGIGGVCY